MIGSLGGTGMDVGNVVSGGAIDAGDKVLFVAGGEGIQVAGPGLFPGGVWVHPPMKTIPIKNSRRTRGIFIQSLMGITGKIRSDLDQDIFQKYVTYRIKR